MLSPISEDSYIGSRLVFCVASLPLTISMYFSHNCTLLYIYADHFFPFFFFLFKFSFSWGVCLFVCLNNDKVIFLKWKFSPFLSILSPCSVDWSWSCTCTLNFPSHQVLDIIVNKYYIQFNYLSLSLSFFSLYNLHPFFFHSLSFSSSSPSSSHIEDE